MAKTRFPVLTPEAMTDEQREVAEAITSGPRGLPLRGPFNAMLRSPKLCDLVQRLGVYVRFSGSIPASLSELAICVVGRKWRAQYMFHSHRRIGIEAGLNPAVPDAIAAGHRPEELRDDEAEVYDFVSELLNTGQVSDACYAPVLERFGERGIVDLVGVVGYFSLASLMLNVAQVRLPEGVKPPLKAL